METDRELMTRKRQMKKYPVQSSALNSHLESSLARLNSLSSFHYCSKVVSAGLAFIKGNAIWTGSGLPSLPEACCQKYLNFLETKGMDTNLCHSEQCSCINTAIKL